MTGSDYTGLEHRGEELAESAAIGSEENHPGLELLAEIKRQRGISLLAELTGPLIDLATRTSSPGSMRPGKLDGFIDTPSKVPNQQDGFRGIGMHAVRKQPRPHNAHGIRNGSKNVDRARGGGRQGARFRFA